MERVMRNVLLNGKRTSFRLEEPFWLAAISCARDHGTSIDQLFTDVVNDDRGGKATMSSKIRTYVIGHLRNRLPERRGA